MAAPLVHVGPGDGLDVNAPLLDPEIQASASEASPAHGDIWVVTPLPVGQVSVLGFAAIAEPVCVNFIYPFINEMLAGMSNGPKQLAFRSGIFFGCFSLAQFCCVYFWGTLSDRIGRKPVLLICLACGITSTAAFGVSATFVQALIFRMITGASYGDVPVLRSAMGDITDSTNQARAFSLLPLAWMVGSTLAPLMGGFLSHPSVRFPKRFGDSQFLIDHPYALPCFVSSALSTLVFIVVFTFFRETLTDKNRSELKEQESMKSPQEADIDSEEASLIQTAPEAGYGSASDNSTVVAVEEENRVEEPVSGFTALSDNNSPPRASALTILGDSTVRIVLLSYFFLALISTSNDVIFALWMFLPIKDGGVGFTPAQIATALSAGSILGTLLMVFFFPWLHRRVGTLIIYRCAMFLDIVLITLYPLVYLVARSYTPKHHGGGGSDDFAFISPRRDDDDGRGGIIGVWKGVPTGIMVGVAGMLIVKAFAGLTWGCNMILVTASAPTPRSLGAVNSMAQMAASFSRAIGPPIYSSIFALSMGSGVLGGKGLIWIFMGIMSSGSMLVSLFVREGEQEWRRSRRTT